MFFPDHTLSDIIYAYRNEESVNDRLFTEFSRSTDAVPFLKEHRDYIENHKLGFGERAFHYMWYLLIDDVRRKNLPLNLLEIGVFKGQVLSLWALIARNLATSMDITGITPLEGKKKPSALASFFLYKFSKKFRADADSGNFYHESDYLKTIYDLFDKFSLDRQSVKIIKGYSTDNQVSDQAKLKQYSVIYIDGDHAYQTVVSDIQTYSNLLVQGGYLIMDDASCNIPGTMFWKGHQSVSDACDIIERMDFINVLNIGHNRIYRRA